MNPETNLMHEIIGERMHVELLKRSEALLVLLCDCQVFTALHMTQVECVFSLLSFSSPVCDFWSRVFLRCSCGTARWVCITPLRMKSEKS